jgi:hypothetical protein
VRLGLKHVLILFSWINLNLFVLQQFLEQNKILTISVPALSLPGMMERIDSRNSLPNKTVKKTADFIAEMK